MATSENFVIISLVSDDNSAGRGPCSGWQGTNIMWRVGPMADYADQNWDW